eukprot:Skav209076  [mRNA]  locus=scaffold207:78178:78687:+ [translate_table: standard]
MRDLKKQENEATKKERYATARAKAKEEKRQKREQVVNLKLKSGDLTYNITTPLNITVGLLRLMLHQNHLRIAKKYQQQIVLTHNDNEITKNRRKTLLGCGVEANDTINFTVGGLTLMDPSAPVFQPAGDDDNASSQVELDDLAPEHTDGNDDDEADDDTESTDQNEDGE